MPRNAATKVGDQTGPDPRLVVDAEALDLAIAAAGYTDETLCKAHNIGPYTLRMYRRGGNFKSATVSKIANALNVPPTNLVKWTAKAPRQYAEPQRVLYHYVRVELPIDKSSEK